MEDALGVAAIGAILFLGLTILLTVPLDRRQRILAFLVGASAGLVAAQILQVHVATILVVVWALFSRRSAKTWTPREAVIPLIAAAVLASTVLYGDLVNSPTLAVQLLAFAFSAMLIVLFGSNRDVSLMLYGLLVTTSAASAWGLLQVAGVAPNDLWHLDVSALGRPTGFYPEPDWLGMFSGIGLVLAWRMPIGRGFRVILITLNMSAWVLAFARAAWIAVAASVLLAVFVYLIIRRLRRRTAISGRVPVQATQRSGRVLAVFLTAAVGAIAFQTIPSLHDNVITRLSRTLTVQADDISAQARVLQNDGLFYLAGTAPWHGWGLSASGRVGVSGILNLGGESTNNIGSNWVVAMWVDGAWLALPLILLLILTTLLAISTIQGQLLALVLLSSLFSNATFQPVTWLLVGACLWHLRDRRDMRLTAGPAIWKQLDGGTPALRSTGI